MRTTKGEITDKIGLISALNAVKDTTCLQTAFKKNSGDKGCMLQEYYDSPLGDEKEREVEKLMAVSVAQSMLQHSVPKWIVRNLAPYIGTKTAKLMNDAKVIYQYRTEKIDGRTCFRELTYRSCALVATPIKIVASMNSKKVAKGLLHVVNSISVEFAGLDFSNQIEHLSDFISVPISHATGELCNLIQGKLPEVIVKKGMELYDKYEEVGGALCHSVKDSVTKAVGSTVKTVKRAAEKVGKSVQEIGGKVIDAVDHVYERTSEVATAVCKKVFETCSIVVNTLKQTVKQKLFALFS